MMKIYCRNKHHAPLAGALCPECRELLDYAESRLLHCPKGNRKTSCKSCEIHCYSPELRARIQAAMRYMGPRMIFYHPVVAVRHIFEK